MLVYLKDGPAHTILRAATLRQKLQIQLPTSPSHSILTPGRPVPALTLLTPGAWLGSHLSAHFEVTGMTRHVKSRRKWDSNPGSSALGADALTTRPTRRSVPSDSHSRPPTDCGKVLAVSYTQDSEALHDTVCDCQYCTIPIYLLQPTA